MQRLEGCLTKFYHNKIFKRMRFFTIAAIVLLLAAASEAKTRRIITDREEARKFILDRKERHKEKTRNLLEQRKTQLAEHHAGRKLLSNDVSS